MSKFELFKAGSSHERHSGGSHPEHAFLELTIKKIKSDDAAYTNGRVAFAIRPLVYVGGTGVDVLIVNPRNACSGLHTSQLGNRFQTLAGII